MSAPKHWLVQNVDEFLNDYNSNLLSSVTGQATMQFTKVQVQIMLFNACCPLIIKEGQGWSVPTFEMQLGSNDDTLICYQILNELQQHQIPVDILRDIQFMDFSQQQPLMNTKPSSTAGVPHQLILYPILTTGTTGEHLGVKNYFLNAIPPNVTLRWAWISFLYQNFDIVHDDPGVLTIGVLRLAQDRVATFGREWLQRTGNRRSLNQTCAEMLWAILETKVRVGGLINVSRGRIVRMRSVQYSTLALIASEQENWDALGAQSMAGPDRERLRVYGRWMGNSVNFSQLPDDFFLSVMHEHGRLNVVIVEDNQ